MILWEYSWIVILMASWCLIAGAIFTMLDYDFEGERGGIIIVSFFCACFCMSCISFNFRKDSEQHNYRRIGYRSLLILWEYSWIIILLVRLVLDCRCNFYNVGLWLWSSEGASKNILGGLCVAMMTSLLLISPSKILGGLKPPLPPQWRPPCFEG